MTEGAEADRPGRRRKPSDPFGGFRPPGHCLDCTRLWSGVTGNPVHPLDWSTERELQLTAATARDACGTNLFSGHESALAGPSG